MAKLVSSTYGDALFELALSEERLPAFFQEITDVREIFLANDDLLKLLNHPKVMKEEKQSIIDSVFSGRVSEETVGLLHIVVEKDRVNDIISICDYFLHRVKEHRGIGTASVTSAIPLNDRQKSDIERRLLETTKYDSFDMDYQVDEGILGGLVIRIGDRVCDSSLKTQVDKLKKQLSRIQLR